MADMTAAQGVNALRQNAQQATTATAASGGTAAAVQPTMQQSIQQEFTQPLIDQNVRAMRPDYADPNEWSYAGDAIAMAFKSAQPGENVMDNLFKNFGTYGQQAAAQRNAIDTNDIAAIQAYQDSGDPLLDIMINWEMPQGRAY
jgi:hypothetical protein